MARVVLDIPDDLAPVIYRAVPGASGLQEACELLVTRFIIEYKENWVFRNVISKFNMESNKETRRDRAAREKRTKEAFQAIEKRVKEKERV